MVPQAKIPVKSFPILRLSSTPYPFHHSQDEHTGLHAQPLHLTWLPPRLLSPTGHVSPSDGPIPHDHDAWSPSVTPRTHGYTTSRYATKHHPLQPKRNAFSAHGRGFRSFTFPSRGGRQLPLRSPTRASSCQRHVTHDDAYTRHFADRASRTRRV